MIKLIKGTENQGRLQVERPPVQRQQTLLGNNGGKLHKPLDNPNKRRKTNLKFQEEVGNSRRKQQERERRRWREREKDPEGRRFDEFAPDSRERRDETNIGVKRPG